MKRITILLSLLMIPSFSEAMSEARQKALNKEFSEAINHIMFVPMNRMHEKSEVPELIEKNTLHIQTLIDLGADVNSNPISLYIAVNKGFAKLLKILLASGVNINAPNKFNNNE